MDINNFKDMLFDIINESDFPIEDIELDDTKDTMKITSTDNSQFLLLISQIQ